MSNYYFGKDCKYFSGQWESSDNHITSEKQDYEPVLNFCDNTNNKNPTEGNCNKINCPLNKVINALFEGEMFCCDKQITGDFVLRFGDKVLRLSKHRLTEFAEALLYINQSF